MPHEPLQTAARTAGHCCTVKAHNHTNYSKLPHTTTCTTSHCHSHCRSATKCRSRLPHCRTHSRTLPAHCRTHCFTLPLTAPPPHTTARHCTPTLTHYRSSPHSHTAAHCHTLPQTAARNASKCCTQRCTLQHRCPTLPCAQPHTPARTAAHRCPHIAALQYIAALPHTAAQPQCRTLPHYHTLRTHRRTLLH
jgi:hypothetical protein